MNVNVTKVSHYRTHLNHFCTHYPQHNTAVSHSGLLAYSGVLLIVLDVFSFNILLINQECGKWIIYLFERVRILKQLYRHKIMKLDIICCWCDAIVSAK